MNNLYSIKIKTNIQAMQIAINQAKKGILNSKPNPSVGCIIVNKKNKIIGIGNTQKNGNHAEIQAIKNAKILGKNIIGSKMYTTLEPCNHIGKNIACTNEIIKSGIKTIICSMYDPNPLVYKKGIKKLKNSGIKVIMNILKKEAYEINIGFFKKMITKNPWIRTKIASSIDSKIALNNGESKWITNKLSRIDNQFWRAKSCAIMTGINTIMKDNPKLNVRYIKKNIKQPSKIIIDKNLNISLKSKILIDNEIIIITCNKNKQKIKNLENLNVKIIYIKKRDINLNNILKNLNKNFNFNEIQIEAGPKLNTSLISENIIDEILIYKSLNLIGDGLNMFNFKNFKSLSDNIKFKIYNYAKIKNNLRLILRKK